MGSDGGGDSQEAQGLHVVLCVLYEFHASLRHGDEHLMNSIVGNVEVRYRPYRRKRR